MAELKVLFLGIVGVFAGVYHGIELSNHDGALGNGAEFPSGKFVDKMAEGVIMFLFARRFLDGKLKLALKFPQKQIIYYYVVGRFLELVLDSDQLEFTLHLLATVQEIQSLEQTDKAPLIALPLRSEEVAHLERHQVEVIPPAELGLDVPPRLEEVVDKDRSVIESHRGQHQVYLGR
jgi:hypothetical protein